MEQKKSVFNKASDIYNKLLTNCELQYTNSEKKRRSKHNFNDLFFMDTATIIDSLRREKKVSIISPLEGDENVEGKEIKL